MELISAGNPSSEIRVIRQTIRYNCRPMNMWKFQDIVALNKEFTCVKYLRKISHRKTAVPNKIQVYYAESTVKINEPEGRVGVDATKVRWYR